ncbi:hypothetical protein ACIPSA_24790 [Streptomyces sp. NPDC086549]|uniref:hypothetical protein n=1 Tax=Streptomyces sp. NPDC086549 TaxID=3365752 RepID=UPI003811AF78
MAQREAPAGSPRGADSWRNAQYVDLRPALTSGANTIALACRNQGGPTGVIGQLRVRTDGGTTDVVTDGGWHGGQGRSRRTATPPCASHRKSGGGLTSAGSTYERPFGSAASK